MCERCDLIDYRVADIWRPCWQPAIKPVKVLIDDGRSLAAENTQLKRTVDQQAEAIRHLQAVDRWPHLQDSAKPPAPKLID